MKATNYKMTIIVPSYNNGKYIRQALDSILEQEVNFKYQIIIADDCSTDNSVDIIREYESKFPEKVLAIYSKKNCKLFGNVLKALELMNSDFFCVLDPDDYWIDKGRLQKSVDFLEKHGDYDIYATNLYVKYNNGEVTPKYDHPPMYEFTSTYDDFLNSKAVLSCTPASTYRNIYFSNGVPDEYRNLAGSEFEDAFRADTARNLIHLRYGGKLYFLNEYQACCRCTGDGLSSRLKDFEKNIIAAYSLIGYYNFFGKKNLDKYVRLIKEHYIYAAKYYFKFII